MATKLIEKKKDSIELEFDSKEVPNIIRSDLIRHNVDSYCYEPHPLIPGYRLYLEAKDATKELKSSVMRVEKDWKDLGKAITEAAGNGKKSASGKKRPAKK